MPDVPGLSAAIDEAADWAIAAAMRDAGFRGSCAPGEFVGSVPVTPGGRGGGYSRIGHYAETAALLSLVCNVVTRTASTCGELAEQLLSATHDFEGTEDAVDEELARLVQDLADPSGRTDVRYGYDDRNGAEPGGIGGAVRGDDGG